MVLSGLRAGARDKLQRALREVLDQQASEQERRHEQLVRELEGVRAEVAALRAEAAVLRSGLTDFEVRARRDLHYAAEVSAAAESAAFALAELPSVPTFPAPR